MAESKPLPAGVKETSRLDLFDLACPQPTYRRIIDDGGVVEPTSQMTVVFRRDLCEFVLRNHQVFSSEIDMGLGNIRPMIPLNVDPPRQKGFRKMLDPLFAPRRMDEQQPDIARRVNGLIDGFLERGECNFTEEFAEVLPSTVFLGLMGLPEDDLATLLRLRDGIMRPYVIESAAAHDEAVRHEVRSRTGAEVYEYFGAALDERRANPRKDILTHFVTAAIEGVPISQDDLLDVCYLFLIAGLDTVSDALTCSFAFLATHPRHRRQLVEDPGIIPAAVEEMLRWESPVATSPRRLVTEDTELPDGTLLREGTWVVASFGGANVDEAEFPDAFDVRFDREENRHLAFGGGVHRCLGSHLARRELRVSLELWHERIPEYTIKPGHEDLEYPYGLRSVKDLMLTWPA